MPNLSLPEKSYGPFCAKILKEFMEHHKLPKLPIPETSNQPHVILSKIFDIMLHSMGDEKRQSILKELDEYKQTLITPLEPAVIRGL